MKFEFSAGGIVYKKDPSTGSGQEKIWILLAKHSQHKGWVFPKGLIDRDKKESKEEAAIREVKEETGAVGEIEFALEPITFWYAFGGEKRKKTVYYFVMKYTGGDINDHDFEMEEVKWVESEKVNETLTFKGEKGLFEKALPEIEKLAKN